MDEYRAVSRRDMSVSIVAELEEIKIAFCSGLINYLARKVIVVMRR